MGAKLGNKNGQKTWIEPICEEKSVQLAVRVSESQAKTIDQLLKPGQLRSEWLREAIALKLAQSP